MCRIEEVRWPNVCPNLVELCEFLLITFHVFFYGYPGRANEHQIPAPEMPQWQKNRSTGGGVSTSFEELFYNRYLQALDKVCVNQIHKCNCDIYSIESWRW